MSDSLADALKGHGGVFYVDEAAVATADFAGWSVSEVSGAEKREVLIAIGNALGFPDYYGANLDALADCLRDLNLDQPSALIWRGWQDLLNRDPSEFKAIVSIIEQQALSGTDNSLALLLPK